MAGDDELNFGVSQRFHHIEVFLPRHSKDPSDAFILQPSNEQVRSFHVHETNLQFFRFLAMKWPYRTAQASALGRANVAIGLKVPPTRYAGTIRKEHRDKFQLQTPTNKPSRG